MLWDTSADSLVVIGEVAIGTATPNAYGGYGALTLNGSTGGVVDLEVNGTRQGTLFATGTYVKLSNLVTGAMHFATDNTNRLTIEADGDINLENNDLLNVGASGNDWTATQLSVNSANDGGYNTLYVNNSSTSADSRARLVVQAPATSGASDPYIYFAVTSGEDVTYGLDQSDSDNLVWSDSDALGTNNRMKLVPSTGVLSVDGDGGGSDDPVSLFDELDDAMEIRRFQLAIPQAPISPAERQANRNRMVEIGVGEWAVQEDGSHRYMDRVQPLSRFLAGGIYQNRERMDAQNEAMDERLKRIEQALGV